MECGSICLDMMKGVPAGLATLVIGIGGLWIAYHQLKLARTKLELDRTKLELDRYDKRYAIFQKTWEILSETAIKGTRERNYGLATPFNNFLPEAAFLFGKDISEYLNECSKNWTELSGLQAEKYAEAGQDRHKKLERTSELTIWFLVQAQTDCKVKFGKYLNIINPG